VGSVLEGIRILDFGRYIAGPFCGMLLADMGAEVIRIEKIDGSEDRYTIPVGQGADGETSVGAMILAVILQGPSAACYWPIWGLKS